MSTTTYSKVIHTRDISDLISLQPYNYNGQERPEGTYKLSREQYMAALPTLKQLQRGLSWIEAILINLEPFRVHRVMSSGSSIPSVVSAQTTPEQVAEQTTATATNSASPPVKEIAVQELSPTELLHAFLKDTDPLPRTGVWDPERRAYLPQK